MKNLSNKKIFIQSYGCKVNQYETRLIGDFVIAGGNAITADIYEADIIIINSCTVTENADKECEYFIRKHSKMPHNPKIILTGCLAQTLPPEKYPQIQIIKNKETLFLEPDRQVVKNSAGKSRAFVKIQDGCESFCSYCIVPYVRIKNWSKPIETVIDEISGLSAKGHAEIVLTGIHVGKYLYGLDNLFNEIVRANLPLRVRLSSIEVTEITNEIIEIFKNNPAQLCRHVHVPLQSGSDKILKQMGRGYSRFFYKKTIEKLRSQMPDIAITTDIITGFPGESEYDFNDTFSFIKEGVTPSDMHVFRYSNRSGTKASLMPDKIDAKIIDSRMKKLFELKGILKNNYERKFLCKRLQAVMIG
ncbi:MAG: MiaB/RimO family radical SAM methylthiotransferase, partial [Elusimicrobia bacterium]|nr:MiaB/RimO family radical SAM methylthiotransferase [Elusimicrobiota bacterium]